MRDDDRDAGVSVAVIAPDGLALLCTGQGYTGHTVKTVYTSGNLGATWIKAGVPGSAGDGGTIAAAGLARLVIATLPFPARDPRGLRPGGR